MEKKTEQGVDRWGEDRSTPPAPRRDRRRLNPILAAAILGFGVVFAFPAARFVLQAWGTGWPLSNDAKVEGRVTYRGRPLKGGYIEFEKWDGTGSAEGKIDGNGNYVVRSAPTGNVRVSFFDTEPVALLLFVKMFSNTNEDLAKAYDKGKASLSANVVAAGISSDLTGGFNAAAMLLLREEWCLGPPSNYYRSRSSLKLTIVKGTNHIDIDLTG